MVVTRNYLLHVACTSHIELRQVVYSLVVRVQITAVHFVYTLFIYFRYKFVELL